MLPRINIISIAVADLKRSVAFYRDGLGWPGDSFRDGGDHVAVELQSGLSLVLFSRDEVARLAGESPAATRSREVVLSYPAGSAAAVDNVLARARAAGGTVPAPPTEQPWGYSGYFLDPDGHLWEVLGDPDFAADIEA